MSITVTKDKYTISEDLSSLQILRKGKDKFLMELSPLLMMVIIEYSVIMSPCP